MNADIAATTPEQRQSEIRNQGVRGAIDLLYVGMPRTAVEALRISVETQARLEGIHADLGAAS